MRRLLTLLLYLALLVMSLGAAAFGVMNYLTRARGVEPDFPVTQKIIGTNVALEQYTSDAGLARALDVLKRAGITHARQYFYWREIEAQRGVYAWNQWDRIVNAARAQGIQVVAVLDTAPVWSQRPNEVDMPNAPPDNFDAYARFAGDFAKRYGDAITYYQIWDEPNVEPNWGKRNADPVEYAQLLIPASQAIRANDPDAKILVGGLAMNLELHRPHPNYSEILFLRGLYEIGAQKYFDIVAAKPYGMWTGPEDRTVNSAVLNFSRLILLRDEMRQYGDADKPVWAVEMGWNALPADWKGAPSPWGTDTEAIQADRLARGLARAENEWAWVTGEFPLVFQPNVPADNPRWGFALVTPVFQLRPLYGALSGFIVSPPAPVPAPSAPVVAAVLLTGVALVSAWRVWHYLFALGLDQRWQGLRARATALPEWAQFLVVAATAVAFYLSPSTPLNFGLMGLLVLLFAVRLDFGIMLTVFVIPFWNFPKTLFGGFQLSPVEALTWIAAAGFLFDTLLRKAKWKFSLYTLRSTLNGLDFAVLAFVVLGLVSTRWAGNFGVASREFRIIVLDPILLYALICQFPSPENRSLIFRRGGTSQDANVVQQGVGLARHRGEVLALLASGVAVCVIGIYQYVTGDVILADGVARLTAVWGSPNNVGLYLGRLLPVALAFAFLLRGTKGEPHAGDGEQARTGKGFAATLRALYIKYERRLYAALVGLFTVTILLTYSRGALFLGLPASALFLMLVLYFRSHHLSRRTWLLIGGAVVVGVIALIPFLTSERFTSLFQAGTGTGFFRIAVWTSAVQMIRDHPLLGVGLDNFLYEYPKYILPEAWREPNLSHPHNFILDFWVRLGIGGLLLYVWMIVAFYKRAWHTFVTTTDLYTRALMLGLMASVVDMLAHGLIDASFFVVDLAYVFLLTLALSIDTPKSEHP